MSSTRGPPSKRVRLDDSAVLVEEREAEDVDVDDEQVDADEGPPDEFDIFTDNEIEVTYERAPLAVEPEAVPCGVSQPPGPRAFEQPQEMSAAGNLVLSLHEKCFASQSDRNELLADAKVLAKDCMRTFAGKIDAALKAKGSSLQVSDVLNVEKSVSGTCYEAFKNVETKAQQEKYFADALGVTKVRRVPLGRIFMRGRKGGVMKTKVVEQELMFVPLEETVQKLINHPDYGYFVENGSSSKDSKILDSYMKGELSKKNNILKEHPDALRFILYYDDLEVCSPLKSRAGKQKIGAFYLLLDNIPPKFRSSLKVICLVALVNANFIKGKQYGMDAALEVIVSALKRFEDGVAFKSGEVVFGTLIATIGDNLGQHALGGFKEGFTANRPCRFCNATFVVEIKRMTVEDSNLLRSKEEYKKQVQQVQTARGKNEKASTEFGLNRESCLNELDSFHVVENMPPDLLHDCLEGSLSSTLKRLLKYYLYEKPAPKLFTLDWLYERIKNFDFDYTEVNDKPSELKEDYIKDESSTSLHQSASQLWLLATILPLILRPLVDVEEPHWENYLHMLSISRMVFTLKFPLWMVNYLRDIIQLYLDGFIKLYGDLIPKQHFLVHYPRLILLLGSLVNYMCLRCEANHKYYKKLISVISAYKNIPLFLARRDQLHQSYVWSKSLRSETACGPRTKVSLKVASFGNLIRTSSGEVLETSWLQINGIKFKPDRCYIVVGVDGDSFPVFLLIKNVIVHPDIAFVCQKVKVVCRNVSAACFIVTLTNDYCVSKPENMLDHSVYHAHNFGGDLAIVTKHWIGGMVP